MSTTNQRPTDLTAQNPWPGLRAFTEGDRDFFFGREREMAELLNLVQRAPVVILYGQSGLGKTSLLQAGLFPDLKKLDFFPVHLRFDHDDGAPPLAEQIKRAISEELDRGHISAPHPEPNETLWEYFHRRDVDFWGPGNRLLTPVLVLDQFEEAFTLGQRNNEASNRVADFSADLESLIEHRPPDAVREHLEAHPEDALHYDLQRLAVKFVISLREDFLADLDPWRTRIPSLLPTRFRLEPMTGAQALDVVQRGGRDLVDPPVARAIVDFASTSQRKVILRAMEQRDVDPSLLSVVCDELNRRRIARGQEKISSDLLTDEREEIIQNFYDRSFDGVDPLARVWVEDELLTGSGYRDRAALEDALKQGLAKKDFDLLVDRRVLHREERSGVVWLELTHDLLTDPASKSRNARLDLLRAKAAVEQESETRKRVRRKLMTAAVFGALLLLILAAGVLYRMLQLQRQAMALQNEKTAFEAKRAAQEKEAEALSESQRNEQSFKATIAMANALFDTRVPALTVVKIIQLADNSYGTLSNQHAASTNVDLAHAQFLTQAAGALYQIGHFDEGLADAQRAVDVLGKLSGPGMTADVLGPARAEALYALGTGQLATGRLSEARQCFMDAANLAASAKQPDLKLAMGRAYVLSEIGQGEVETKQYALERGRVHFNEALKFIGSFGSSTDEILSWKAMALRDVGQSQPGDAEAVPWFTQANDILVDLMAHDPSNLRWKRLYAGLAYSQGVGALNLDQPDEASKWFEKAQTVNEELNSRDSENIDWRLSLSQGWRGLGLVHLNRGELDAAQDAFQQAEQIIKSVSVAQPSWTQAGYVRGSVAISLGDVLRNKYTNDKTATDLDEAFKKFGEARDLLQESVKVAPRDLVFVRSLGLAIGRQGYVRAAQGGAVDTDLKDAKLAKAAEDNKNGKEKDAIQFYNQALDALRPIEGAARESTLIQSDEAYYWIAKGDAWIALENTAEAISSYQRGASILTEISKAESAKKSPSASIYDRIARVYVAIGDAEANVKADSQAFAKADAQYGLAAKAESQALAVHASDTGFLREKALIQGRESDTWFNRGDYSKSLDSLDAALSTVWSALQLDYSDLTLNQDLDYYRKRLDRVKSTLDGSDPGATPPQIKLSADQTKALLKKIDTLDEKTDPAILLDRNEKLSTWVMEPMMPGAWRILAGAERTNAIQQLTAADKNLKADQIWGIRRLPLEFYSDAVLYEAEIAQASGQHGIISYVKRGSATAFLNGTSTPIFSLNKASRPNLDTADRAIAYLRFFLGAIQDKDVGRFLVTDDLQDFHWNKEPTSAERTKIAAAIKPLIVEPSSDGGWQAIGTIQFDGYPITGSFHLSRLGDVSMQRDKTASNQLSVYIERYISGIRVLETVESADAEKAKSDEMAELAKTQQQLKTNPTDEAALQKLPQMLFKQKRWQDAIDAEKNWLTFIQDEAKIDPKRNNDVRGAYVSLAWYQLFARDFAGSLASSQAGKKLDPKYLPTDTNLAHALLFLGRVPEADAIYLSHLGVKDDSLGGTWEETILKDFDDLEREGITSPEFPRLRSLLAQGKGKE